MSRTAPPALFNHCKAVYEGMRADAEPDGDGTLIWSGSLTKFLTELGLTNPYYSAVTKALKAMDCIRSIRRGGGGQPSQWAVLEQEPTMELWEAFVQRGTAAQRRVPSEQENGAALRALNERIIRLEQRIDVLEARVS